ncbi:hypothetical protein [Oligoflexus tunisiensis]|uniref:hypothetical protein n=1 Tax=Oligoflexus tunisiensis TaxID=708132 RepID=UPI00114CA01C|nr:hypothetical protein [Oligoflexus tunisiensis]
MKIILTTLILAGSLHANAYGAIPAPSPAEEVPDTAVSEDVDEDIPEGEVPDAEDVAIEQPEARPTPDTTSTNTPSMDWYKDMHQQLYDMQQHAQAIQQSYYSYELTYYAAYLYHVLDKLYHSTYDSYGKPKKYGWGYPTRGDFNYIYYYWIRPLYKKMIHHGGLYYSHTNPYYHQAYKKNFQSFYYGYHSLTRCMYGKNSNDPQAEDDTAWVNMEAKAGFLKR